MNTVWIVYKEDEEGIGDLRVMGVYSSEEVAKKAASRLKEEYPRDHVCYGDHDVLDFLPENA